jgi:hypothetical protein
MSDQPPILEGKPLSEEHKRLIALFDQMKKNQLTFLDEAGKRIIELSTGLLGVLFAVTAFGNNFPPPYLQANPLSRWLVVGVLLVFVLSLLFGVLTVQPRDYPYNDRNLTSMRDRLTDIVDYKSRLMKIATWLFFAGSTLLAALIAAVVLGG